MNLRDHTTIELQDRAQGCTELTCPFHGRYNFELVRRGAPRGFAE